MKTYNTPILSIHGTVESITEATGNRSANDVLFFNGQPLQNVNVVGSRDVRLTGQQ